MPFTIMQAVQWVPVTPITNLHVPYWMGLWFGVFPTWQTLLGQLGAAVFVIGSYYLAEWSHKRPGSQRPPGPTNPAPTERPRSRQPVSAG